MSHSSILCQLKSVLNGVTFWTINQFPLGFIVTQSTNLIYFLSVVFLKPQIWNGYQNHHLNFNYDKISGTYLSWHRNEVLLNDLLITMWMIRDTWLVLHRIMMVHTIRTYPSCQCYFLVSFLDLNPGSWRL